jgi:hypothetical protein
MDCRAIGLFLFLMSENTAIFIHQNMFRFFLDILDQTYFKIIKKFLAAVFKYIIF